MVGVGNEFNGDDAAGLEIIRRLPGVRKGGVVEVSPRVLLVEGGVAPENFTGVLRRFAPRQVILFDAAEMGDSPGAIQVLDWRDSSGFGPSTHMQPPSTLAEFLQAEIGCLTALVGIQPAQLEFDAPLSSAVESAVEQVVGVLRDFLLREALQDMNDVS